MEEVIRRLISKFGNPPSGVKLYIDRKSIKTRLQPSGTVICQFDDDNKSAESYCEKICNVDIHPEYEILSFSKRDNESFEGMTDEEAMKLLTGHDNLDDL